MGPREPVSHHIAAAGSPLRATHRHGRLRARGGSRCTRASGSPRRRTATDFILQTTPELRVTVSSIKRAWLLTASKSVSCLKDNDQDAPQGCAKRNTVRRICKGGWWCRHCQRSNLNGLYLGGANTTIQRASTREGMPTH